MTYDTFSSQKVENLPYVKKSYLQKGRISLFFKLNGFRLVLFETIHSYTLLDINARRLYIANLIFQEAANVFFKRIFAKV